MEYKTVFIDSDNSKKGSRLVPTLNGDNIAREIQAALNQLHEEGYALFNTIEINSTPNALMEGLILVFRKEKNQTS